VTTPDSILILVVEAENGLRESISEPLRAAGYRVEAVATATEAVLAAGERSAAAAVVAGNPRTEDERLLITVMRERAPDMGVIALTPAGSVGEAVEAMRAGAYDCVAQPVDGDRLLHGVQRLLQHQKLLAENQALRARLTSTVTFGEIVRRSHVMREVCATIEQAAGTDVPVLITGETGTGKELVARAIHQRSPRMEGPLVTVNCGAIPETLFERELFGHIRGAFTGAHADRPGQFQSAHTGTLFFDEVGEIPLHSQVNLLRVLEEKRFTPIGSTKVSEADVRTIFATNRVLEKEIREGHFREDLFYRLNVVRIRLPALRERREDIPLLVETFLDQLCSLHHRSRKYFSPAAMEMVLEHRWPGNVRQLKNVVEQMVVTCPDREIDTDRLRDVLGEDLPENGEVLTVTLGTSIEEVEKALILKTLAHVTSHRKQAAEILGISVRSLQYKLKSYDMES